MIDSKNDISRHDSQLVAGRQAARNETRKAEGPTEFANYLKAATPMAAIEVSTPAPEPRSVATPEVAFDLDEQTTFAATSFSPHQGQTELYVTLMANTSGQAGRPIAMELVTIESAVLDPDIIETKLQPVLPFHKIQAGRYGLAKGIGTDIPAVELPVALAEDQLPVDGEAGQPYENIAVALTVRLVPSQPATGRQAISFNQVEPGFSSSMPHHAVLAQVDTVERSGAIQDPRIASRAIELPTASVQIRFPPGESMDRPSTIREAIPVTTPPPSYQGGDRPPQPNGTASNSTDVPDRHAPNNRGGGESGGKLVDGGVVNESIEAASLRSESMRPGVEVLAPQPGSLGLQISPARQIIDMVIRALPIQDLHVESTAIKTFGFILRPEQLGEVMVTLRLRGKVLELKIETQTADAARNIERDRTLLGQLLHGIGLEAAESNILITVRNQPPTSLVTDQSPFATPQHHREPGANSSDQPRQGAPGQQTETQAAASSNGRPDDETQAPHVPRFNLNRGIYV